MKWLRVSMSYHKFPNVRELLQADLTMKFTKELEVTDFMGLPCNCLQKTTTNRNCIYGGNCRKSLVVYKATCIKTGKAYIGNTQQKLKKRIDAYLSKTCEFVKKNKHSNRFSKKIASRLPTEAKITRNYVREKVQVEILWQGKAISCVNTFGKLA